ncbi:MAG: bifunctional GTP diphosphokinase/guanosine-3',5'-bis pyrophosphate 3'-pyrophosphohydrolase [Gammaproteobacteria bacterium]|nr:bifunctional GTP diphosphokinase/guanosine-3',5'-bis pyrophosphate 3'-pyrophosphohydrolase [Gammaproteobacteria bacterium]
MSDLCALLETYLEPAQVSEVYRAYLFGAEAHEGQHRLSGEPYIYHPLAVAKILATMRMDAESLIAAILHDIIEDTPTAKEQLREAFGEEVAELVDGVSKLTQIKFRSRAEAQAENFRKMFLAMAQDIRVILIKLADRLHNMRTLGVMPEYKRRRIARETLEIFAPIASRLGINTMRLELEDLGFAALYPMRYRILEREVRKARGHRKEIVAKIQTAVEQRLEDEGVAGKVIGREKHLWSIYQKMRSKALSFSEVLDVYAFRIVVGAVEDCYRVLGIVHNLYKPVPGRFKDYIAIPKANGYQSLHTTLFGPYGVPIEVQIRTQDMDNVAESGIAAHWLYKSREASGARAQARAREWLRELLEIQRSAGNSLEFIENVKVDLFPDEVYVFTPRGEIMELPRGATALDFAYGVHSDLGNKCVAVKVDRRLVPLRTPLRTGQTVEIITAPGGRPDPAWLDFVVTAKARSSIRHYLKNLQREEAVALGRRLLERSLGAFALTLDALGDGHVKAALADLGVVDLETLLEDIGLGNRMPLLAARRLAHIREGLAGNRVQEADSEDPLLIKGTEGMVVNLAKCCRPIPGDPILGFVSAGRGIVIHRGSCRNVAEYRNRPEKWVEVQWDTGVDGEFPVEIRVDVANQKGVLATVAATIAELNSNIENVELSEREGVTTTLVLTVTVRERKHLARIMRHIRAIPQVSRAYRPRR